MDNDELVMLSAYINNQQEVINELTKKNMQLTTEVQVLRSAIKQHEKINRDKVIPKKRLSPTRSSQIK